MTVVCIQYLKPSDRLKYICMFILTFGLEIDNPRLTQTEYLENIMASEERPVPFPEDV